MDNISINPNISQVFICAGPACIPFSFAIHPWFVCNKKGDVHRWELCHTKNILQPNWGHIYRDRSALFGGTQIFLWTQKRHRGGNVLYVIEGSPAEKLIEYIEKTPTDYLYKDHYSFLGPNSNTYLQSILDHFPDLDIQLPWNAIGKGYQHH